MGQYGQNSNNIFDRRRSERDSICVHQQKNLPDVCDNWSIICNFANEHGRENDKRSPTEGRASDAGV